MLLFQVMTRGKRLMTIRTRPFCFPLGHLTASKGSSRFGVRICSKGGISERCFIGKGNKFLGSGRVGLVLVVEVFLHGFERCGFGSFM